MSELPSNSELFRGISDLKIMSKEHYDISLKWHEENTLKLNDLNTKVAVQNGRVAKSEEAITLLGDKFVKTAEKLESVVNKWWYVAGGFAVILLVGGLFAKLYIRDQVSDVLQSYDIEITP